MPVNTYVKLGGTLIGLGLLLRIFAGTVEGWIYSFYGTFADGRISILHTVMSTLDALLIPFGIAFVVAGCAIKTVLTALAQAQTPDQARSNNDETI